MRKITLFDPYRKRETTFQQFAQDENAGRMSVYLYFRRHGSLEGYRERPAIGNGQKPHTYKYKGKFISPLAVKRVAGVSPTTLYKYKKRGITDIDKIKAAMQRKEKARTCMVILEDGTSMPCSAYAKAHGVSHNCVYLWAARYGSMKGFENRRPSRLNPTRYRDETGEEHSIGEWAAIYKRKRETIQSWTRKHGTMVGYRAHRHTRPHSGHHKGAPMVVELHGQAATFKEWATRLNMREGSVRSFFAYHGSLDGIDEPRRLGRPRKQAVEQAQA